MKNLAAVMTLMVGALMSSGCASVPRVDQTFGPQGEPAFAVSCSGERFNMDSCYSAAGNACGPRGYNVISRTEEPWSYSTTNDRGTKAATTAKRSILVACK